ncbi:hypothetical protein DFP73DRAFT_566207 [Morchella snyderi]|nr:hypothetical protein DFP73DRAFT_566207 [Morchella snyderi]
MPDPLSIIGVVLGVVTLLKPVLKAVQTYKLTNSFGKDYYNCYRRLQNESVQLELFISICLESSHLLEPAAAHNVSKLSEVLAEMLKQFQICEKLLKKYVDTPSGLPDEDIPQNSSLPSPRSILAPEKTKKRFGLFRDLRKPKPKNNKLLSSPTVSSQSSGATGNTTRTLCANQSVTDSYNKQRDESESLQNATRMYSRVVWVILDRNEFISAIEILSQRNKFLLSIAQLRSLSHETSTTLLTSYASSDQSSSDLRGSLQRLHSALILTNGPSKTDHLEFSIALGVHRTKPEEDIDIDWRPESHCFRLLAHKLGPVKSQSCSSFLLAETIRQNAIDNSSRQGLQRETVRSLRSALREPDGSETWPPLGAIPSAISSSDVHHIFQDTCSEWKISMTLADLLINEDMGSNNDMGKHLKLAISIASGYSHLGSLVPALSNTRPESYRYYDPVEDEGNADETIKNDKIAIHNPWLFAGFGCRRQRKTRQEVASGSSVSKNTSVIEMGLLLYQVGCWKRLDYGISVNELRFQAKNTINEVVRRVGVKFSNAVEACLDYRGSAGDLSSFYENVVLALQGLEQELYG